MNRVLLNFFVIFSLLFFYPKISKADLSTVKNISSEIWSTFEEKTKINLPKLLKKKETNTQVFNVNDEALKINPTYLKSLNYEEKIKLSKSLYKSANKNFKQKKIIRGCSELYQMSILNAMDEKLFKRAKKRVNKYNCTQYNFANLELNSENVKNAKIICATKSGFSEYRISEDFCNSDENQILNGTDEYYQVLAFIENKTLSKPIKSVNRNYVCSIWQASSFKIVNYIDETSRCTDIFYEDSHQENYKIFSKYINNVISNDKYTSLKVLPGYDIAQSTKTSNKKYKNIVSPFFCTNSWLGVQVHSPDRQLSCASDKLLTHSQALDRNRRPERIEKNNNHFRICLNPSNKHLQFLESWSSNGKGKCPYDDMILLSYDGSNYFYFSEKKTKYAKLNIANNAELVSVSKSLTLSELDSLKAQIFGCWSVPLGLPYGEDLLVRVKIELNPDGTIRNAKILDHERMNKPGQGYYKVLAESTLRAVKLCQPLRLPSSGYERWKTITLNFDAGEMLGMPSSKNTKTAKKLKPNEMKTIGNSQVEKLSIDNQKLKFCVDDRIKNYYSPYINTSNSECVGFTKKTNFAKYIEEKFRWNFERISNFQKSEKELFEIVKNTLIAETERYGLKKSELEEFISNSKYSKFETKIAKEKPAVIPKKKVKVAKKEETKQEQFKPEDKDNDAPIIEIAENITVNDSNYEIRGKVIDKSKKLFVQVDGETIAVKNGNFSIPRFSPIDEQLKIVAIDQWGNKSKPKIVNVTVDIKETIVADKLEQLNPSLIKSRSNKNRVALIIGIEKYEQTPAANFANLDAQYFYEYARKGFGIPKANIKLLVDEEASLIKSISTINKWLPSKIKSNQTELIIFFAGHGLASNNGEELYILPQDSDPDLLSRTALSRTELFEQIIKLNPKSVTMFMDTCYSGISRDEKMLLASARPIRIVADEQDGIPDNFTIFSASKLDQISSGLKEAEHGIFSYYLMKGLEGKADSNQDKKITNGELLSYMNENVSQKAAELGREQNPSLAGDPDKVLISYR